MHLVVSKSRAKDTNKDKKYLANLKYY